jgi:hypothetical protein
MRRAADDRRVRLQRVVVVRQKASTGAASQAPSLEIAHIAVGHGVCLGYSPATSGLRGPKKRPIPSGNHYKKIAYDRHD